MYIPITGSQQFMDKVGEYNIVYIDPVGAIIISIYILANWWKTGHGTYTHHWIRFLDKSV